jgi:ribonuclease BN (tRNA processing enzyme)
VAVPAPFARLTILGSGTLVPNEARNSAAHHLDTHPSSVLLDCGPGTLHGLARHGVDWQRLTHVAISHFHNDHVSDLAALLNAFKHSEANERTHPLTLIGPPGFAALLGGLRSVYGDYVMHQRFGLQVVELGLEDAFAPGGGELVMRTCPTAHTDNSVAFLVDGPWGSLGYTGDTGPSDDVGRLLEGVDVLISECTLADPPVTDRHLSPAGLAEMASAVRPGLLVVTHVAPPQTPEEAVARVRDRYEGRTVAAVDGLVARISREGVTVDLPGGPV